MFFIFYKIQYVIGLKNKTICYRLKNKHYNNNSPVQLAPFLAKPGH